MSLRAKIYIIFIVTWLIILTVIIIGSSVIILKDYKLIEQKDIKANYTRAIEALDRMKESLNLIVADWAHWNDTYNFILDKNDSYIKDNLQTPTAFRDLKVNFILLFDDKSNYKFSNGYDLFANQFTNVPQSLIAEIIKNKNILLQHEEIRKYVNGFLIIPEGIVLLSSFPITDSDAQAKPMGNIIMAYYLNQARLNKLSETLNVNLDIQPLERAKSISSNFLPINHLNTGINYFSEPQENNLISIFSFLKGINKKPIGLIHIKIPRSTYQQGIRTIRHYVIIVTIVGLIILLIVELLLRYLIVGRIDSYKKQLEYITSTSDFSNKISISGKDEISSMVNSSNEMLSVINTVKKQLTNTIDELTEKNKQLNKEINEHQKSKAEIIDLNEQLLFAARQSGMAEVATSVLHNVGNILNSLNISSSLLREKLNESKFLNTLQQIIEVLEDPSGDFAQHLTNSVQGKNLIKYLSLVIDSIHKDRENASKELESIIENIQHIKEVVTAQQNLGKVVGIIELVSVSEQLDSALQIVGFDETYKIEKKYQVIEPIMTDKVKLMQILVNLLRNAKDALVKNASEDRKLALHTKYISNKQIEIQVIDNGIGITQEDLKQIFIFGFTTKKEGHGYGLHNCALLAKEIGGSLQAESKGLGQGAIFTLTIPNRK